LYPGIADDHAPSPKTSLDSNVQVGSFSRIDAVDHGLGETAMAAKPSRFPISSYV